MSMAYRLAVAIVAGGVLLGNGVAADEPLADRTVGTPDGRTVRSLGLIDRTRRNRHAFASLGCQT